MDVLASIEASSSVDYSSTNQSHILAPDRFLKACPIRYECRRLFIYLIEMELFEQTNEIETIFCYPEERDGNYFHDDAKLNEFIANVKRFAFPYRQNLKESKNVVFPSTIPLNSTLVQFYTFVITDANRIRQYGFCRSSHGGNHIICMISYLPWNNIFMSLLNKISTIINEKEIQSLYYLLEALYEYELPEPGKWAQIFSHDGLDQVRFQCPDRRLLPLIQENRALLKFFAFFDLNKLKQIFTALLLERSLLVVSRDLENLTSCGLSFEYLIYPLEWLHTFVPIVPEHIDLHVFNQPFPFIYGVHQCIFERLNLAQLENCVILLVDEKKIMWSGIKSPNILPQNIDEFLTKRLEFFSSHEEGNYNGNLTTTNLLQTATIKAFLDSVMMIIDDYREYLVFNTSLDEYRFDETAFFKMKGVYNDDVATSSLNKYQSDENEFYHEFRVTQAFEEFCRDRCDYLKAERIFYSINPKCSSRVFQKDFIETLYDQFKAENSKLSIKLDKKFKILKNKAKEKSTTIRTNLLKTRNQFIKKSSRIENDLKSTISSNIATDASITKSLTTQYKPIDEKIAKSEKIPAESFGPCASLTQECSSQSSSSSTRSSRSSSFSPKAAVEEDKNRKGNVQETIRKFEETTEKQTKSTFRTMDLSNNLDITKYFDTDEEINEEKADNSNISLLKPSKPMLQASQQSDNLIDILNEISETTGNKSSMITNILKPSSSESTSEKKTEPGFYKSILNEFDPLTTNVDSNVTTGNINNSFNTSNFTQTQFQMPKTSTEFRPNYNISIPLSTVVSQIPQSQSMYFHHTPNPSLYAPRPFYLSSNKSMNFPTSTLHRPVNFNPQQRHQLQQAHDFQETTFPSNNPSNSKNS